jgi:hypothetical protein
MKKFLSLFIGLCPIGTLASPMAIRTLYVTTLLFSFSSTVVAQSRCETVLLDEHIRLTGTSPGAFTLVPLRTSIELMAGDSLYYEISVQPENGGYIDIDVSVFRGSLTNLIFFDSVHTDSARLPSGEIPIETDGLYFVESLASAEYIASGFTSVSVVATHGCEPRGQIPANIYDPSSNLLKLKVAVDEVGFGVSFSVSVDTAEATPRIKAVIASLEVLPEAGDDFASFDSSTDRLFIPEIFVDGEVAFRNVIFELTDASQLIFHLVSLE